MHRTSPDPTPREATLADLLAGIPRVEYVGCGPDLVYRGLYSDSRRACPGSAFIALVGERFDAHRFIPELAARGIAVAIIERGKCPPPDCPHVWLDSTGAALAGMAARHFLQPASGLRLAGITGTNGKTTCAHLVSSILEHTHKPHFRLGTTGNWLVDHEVSAGYTTPPPIELQSLLAQARRAGAIAGVMEVSSHAIVQGRAEGLRFRSVGLTSFSQDHLDFHASLEDYLAAKCQLAGAYTDNKALAVAHHRTGAPAEQFLRAAQEAGAQTLACTRSDGPDFDRAQNNWLQRVDRRLHVIEWSDAATGLRAELEIEGTRYELHSPLVGDYNLDNLILSLAIAHGLGIEYADGIEALALAGGAPGRLEPVQPGYGDHGPPGGPRVLVDYAHTPDAVARACAVVRRSTRGKLWVILGCGGDRDRSKRPLMAKAALETADGLVATSDNPRSEQPAKIIDDMLVGLDAGHRSRVQREDDRARAIAQCIATAQPEDTVLIAGKGHEDYQIIGDERIHFDDREHARAALDRRASSARPESE